MRNRLTRIIFLSYLLFIVTTKSSSPPLNKNLPVKLNILPNVSCSPIIEQQFIGFDFSCIDGCVVLKNTQSITLASLIVSDIETTITTCISFSDIEKVEIDTLTLSNLIIEIDHSSNNFIRFSNIGSLNISKLSISNISQLNPSDMGTAIYIDSSVLSQTIQTIYSSSQTIQRNFKQKSPTYPFYLVLSSNAHTSNVSTININNSLDRIFFSSVSTIEFDQIIFEQAISSKTYHFPNPTLKLRAQISITVNSIQILDKRDTYKILTTDLSFTAVLDNDIQTQIVIGSITRNAASIQNKLIQQTQSGFLIIMDQEKLSQQLLNPNIVIHFISASMNNVNSAFLKQPSAQLSLEISNYNMVTIDSVLLSDYTKQFISFYTVGQFTIGSLQVAKNQDVSYQQNSFIIDECLIYSQNSNIIVFDNIILQNAVISQISYLAIGSVSTLIIKQLLIQNSVFINSQFLYIVESIYVMILNTQILDSALRMSVTKEFSSPIFIFSTSQNVEFNEFVMKSPNLNIAWIESLESNHLLWSQNIILTNNCTSLTFTGIHVDFLGQQLGFFSSLEQTREIVLSNSTFDNCFASLGGGCFQFNLNGNVMAMYEPRLFLSNVTFIHASSGYFGGAIFGSQIIQAINVRFESCSSLIGGALYLRGYSTSQALSNITFVNNVADITHPNYCLGVEKVKKGRVLEFNPSLSGTPLYLNPIGQYSDEMEFYAGILYIYELELLIGGKWYSGIPSQRTIQNQFNQVLYNNGNLFPFSTQVQLLQNSFIVNETNFFLLYDPASLFQNQWSQLQIGFTFSLNDGNYITLDQVSTTSCKEGMEEILFSNGYNHICQYCGLSKAIYSPCKICQSCDVSYFQNCFSNQTELNKGYWRSNYTINTTLIETCSISMQSCNGGYGIGNSLCYEGHIGPQCLNCDIRGEYWGQSYSIQDVYTCNKCRDIQYNEIKIIIGLILISLSLFIIIKGNYKATKNQIYADYLSKIKMIYIGSSLSRLQQMSTCLKVLLFNFFFSNLVNSFTKLRVWKSLSETSVILNQPLVTQIFSIDCFLVNIFSKDLNIGFANLVISIATPGIIFVAHLVLCILMLLANKIQENKKSIRKMGSSLILSFTYLYLIVFYPFIFQLCLKSFYCIRLDGELTFSQIDLSLECGHPQNNSLNDIHNLASPLLCLVIIFMPLAILLFLYYRKEQLKTVRTMLTFGFLYREYKSNFYLWEFVRIILKSVCVFTQVALIGNPQVYGTIIALLLTVYLVLLNFKQPFKGKLFNKLEQISVSIQILSIQSAVLYQQYELNQILNGTVIEILFIGSQMLNVIFVICLSILIIISFLQKSLIKLHRKCKIPFAERFLPVYSTKLRNNFKRLRYLVNQFKGRIHSIRVDELQNLLLSEDSEHNLVEEVKSQEETIDYEDNQQQNLIQFDSDSIDSQKLLSSQ